MGKIVFFISGPMSGIEDHNHPAFIEAEKHILEKYPNSTVLNPARLPQDLNPWNYMPIDLAMLREADYIYVLHGWETHMGCRCEVEFAKKIQTYIIFEDEEKEETSRLKHVLE